MLISEDNVFGTDEEDARRRDFTLNGLFYDVGLGEVIDYVSGRLDLAARTIRTIGNPEIRLREDPVRLLRAVRFAAKLDFEIEPETWSAMRHSVAELSRCAPARVFEETLRLLRSGVNMRLTAGDTVAARRRRPAHPVALGRKLSRAIPAHRSRSPLRRAGGHGRADRGRPPHR